MDMTIRQAASENLWNLYVNGNLAVSLETRNVVECIAEALRNAQPVGLYSEGAEIADAIRRDRVKRRAARVDWAGQHGL